jgi:hypothetical protein
MLLFLAWALNRKRIRSVNRKVIRTRVEAIFSYGTENHIAIRFAPNCTGVRTGNRIRVDGPP